MYQLRSHGNRPVGARLYPGTARRCRCVGRGIRTSTDGCLSESDATSGETGSKERSMEHRWGHRLATKIPVRLRCMRSPDSGCRCLGCLESVSASGAFIRTELGIRPARNVVVETLSPTLGMLGRELPASVVRADRGEMAVEWMEFASSGVSAVMTETMVSSGEGNGERTMPTLGRVPFCALASAAQCATAS